MAKMNALLADIRKTFAKTNPDIIYDRTKKVEFVDSGSLVFNLVASQDPTKGFPIGRLSEVFGMEHSGKTSLVLAALAAIQRAARKAGKGVGVLIDAETAWDPAYASNTFGLTEDNETFAVFQPDNIEEIDVLCEKLFALDDLLFLAFDSVDAMKPKALIEGSLENERRVGAHAQAMSRFVAKMRKFAKAKRIPVVFINQMRTNITTGRESDQNTGTGAGFNPMEKYTVTGGMALRYYASLRMKLEYGGRVEDEQGHNLVSGEQEKIRAGNKIKVINIKNKVSTPFLKSLATFTFPAPGIKGGWDNDQDLLEILKKRGRITQQSTRFTYKGLAIKEWSNVGGKKASEAMFLSSAEMLADARELLSQLLKPAEGADAPATLVLDVATAEDFSDDDVAGQEDPSNAVPDDEAPGVINLGNVLSAGVEEIDTTPSDELSM